MNRFFVLTVLCFGLATAQSSSYQTAAFINDNNVLNYALTLENLEYTMYKQALNQFTMQNFLNEGFSAAAYNFTLLIRDQEMSHVSFINMTLAQRGWPAVQPCTYNFPNFTSVTQFLTFAAAVETMGVSAYDGAVPYLSNPSLLQYAATIATVEARHTAYLNLLTNMVPFPVPADIAFAPADVVRNVSGYLNQCPSTTMNTAYNGTVTVTSKPPALPTLANVIRNMNATFATISGVNVNISQTAMINDNRVLNLALSVETFCTYFYSTLLGPLVNASSLTAAGYNGTLAFQYYSLILEQERNHVSAIQMTLASRNAGAVAPCNYTFATNVTSVQQFVAMSQIFELVGLTAYDGSIAAITDANLAAVAATFATVEGRHASFVNNLGGANPFPQTFDTPNTPQTIIQQILPYIYNCPTPVTDPITNTQLLTNNLTLPVVLDYFNQNVSSVQGTNAGSTGTNTGSTGTNTGSTGTTGTSTAGSTGSNTGTGNNGGNSAVSMTVSMVVLAILALIVA